MSTEILDLPKSRSRKIPSEFVREELRGKKFYYKGYKDVLAGTKQLEEITGSSSLQSIIVFLVGFLIKSNLDKKQYWVATNEAGLHLGLKNNLSTDVGIFSKEKVTPNDKYFDVAPEIAIEVDVKIETDKELDYIFAKSEEMKAFGCQKILWIITKHKKIFVFARGADTVIYEWDKDIELMEGSSGQPIVLNLKKLLAEEGL